MCKLCYGANWEPAMSWFNQRFEDIKISARDQSKPPLPWWDKLRLLFHGRIYALAESLHWFISTSLDPYNSTEFFVCEWSNLSANWDTGIYLN